MNPWVQVPAENHLHREVCSYALFLPLAPWLFFDMPWSVAKTTMVFRLGRFS